MVEKAGTTIVARESRPEAAARLVGCLIFVTAGVLGAQLIPNRSLALLVAASFFAVLSIRFMFSLARPGYLRISDEGIEQDLGWRRAVWPWDQISDVMLHRTPLGITAVLIRRTEQNGPVRLFGWSITPVELNRVIDRRLRKGVKCDCIQK